MTGFYDLQATSIEGNIVSFSEYKDKSVLIVNTASKCGFTSQYKGLESLYNTYKTKGFVVLGFPSNQFGGQEPGTEKEIKEFCSLKFGVNFPLFKKSDVKGAGKNPVFKFLSVNAPGASEKSPAEPKWNFSKYLIDKKGHVVGFYGSMTSPEDKKLKADIEKTL